jgi:hypothetical protein
MLDLDHPMSEHVFAAARAESAIVIAARRMTVASRQERLRLRDSCGSAFDELRRLARDHFSDRTAIPAEIDALERAVAGLAALPGVREEGPRAEEICPACGDRLKGRGRFWSWALPRTNDNYCRHCLQMIISPLQVLESCEDGFGTEAI